MPGATGNFRRGEKVLRCRRAVPARSGAVEPPLPENRAGGKPGKTCFGGRRLMHPPKRPRGGGRGEKGCAIFEIRAFGIVSHAPFFLSKTIGTKPEPFNSKSRTYRYPPLRTKNPPVKIRNRTSAMRE